MKALVVYESVWGNTREVAFAIGAGIGLGTPVLSTLEATPDRLAGLDLLVCGAPLQGFSLPTERGRASIDPSTAPAEALEAPTLRSWLETIPSGSARCAAFDTKLRWSPGSAAHSIERELEARGYVSVVDGQHFLVTGKAGPLKVGELVRARQWGGLLASLVPTRAELVSA